MLPSATALATQQLAEFLAVISDVSDEPTAIRAAAECAAQAMEAEVGAVLDKRGVRSAVGFARGRTPEGELAEVARGKRHVLEVPGAGRCRTVVVPIDAPLSGHLLVARAGEDGFTVDEASLLRGMARVLELTIARLHTLEAERRRAAENLRLLAALRERHRLLEELSKIQRAIARQEPFQTILDAITRGAQELLGDDAAGLRLRDPDDTAMTILHASRGFPRQVATQMWRTRVEESGAAGLAMMRDELVVLEDYSADPHAVPELADGTLRSAMAAPVHDNGVVVGGLVVGSFGPRDYGERDRETLRVFADHVSLAVTDHRTREKMYEAHHDGLTGLANRALFLERLDHALARAARQPHRLIVLFIDLDRFKIVNDSIGHAGGDALLIEVANRLRSCLRLTDTAARFGGDEFAVALFDLSLDEAAKIARRILSLLQEPFFVLGKEVFVDASIGIGFNTEASTTGEDLIRAADMAMYQAKRNGKGRFETFEPAMQDRLMRTLDLDAALRRSVERGDFVLYYQPILDLVDERIRAVEALVRWHHPERGLVSPQEFVPLAEETGLIVPIGGWVLREACRQAAVWNAARPGEPPLTVSVNLSARQLQVPDLPELVAEALRDARLDPACLVLEITESLLLHDTDAMIGRLCELKRLGLRLALDDFGTGYSALAYLRRFPIDMIKIDKSFVAEMAAGREASALARAIVQLGRTLGLTVVAEGIETAEQLRQLRDAGCPLGQGHYFARPLEAEELASMVGLYGTPAP
jgi:diguanylate cyclase (GGDEF)-like protein